MDIAEIVRSCPLQNTQRAVSDVVRSFAYKTNVTRDYIFKVTMHICKFMVESKLTDPQPTMFTVHGSFSRRSDCPDEMHEFDLQTCILPIPPIVQIKSNYGHVWHESYTPKEPKPKRKEKKKRGGIQGNGSSFNSQTTFTVMLQKEYGVKIFRKLKYVIPHCIKLDGSDAREALTIVIDVMNDTWPGRDYYVEWKNMKTPMHNFRYQLRRDPDKCVAMCGLLRCREICRTTRIDLQQLTDILKVIWEEENMATPPDREVTANYAGLLVRFWSGNGDGKTVTVCIQKKGKITINGTVSIYYYMAIYEWCNWIINKYADHILYDIRPTIALSDSEDSDDSIYGALNEVR